MSSVTDEFLGKRTYCLADGSAVPSKTFRILGAHGSIPRSLTGSSHVPVVGCLLYALLGLAQISAYIDGVRLWLGLNSWLAIILFLGTAALPFGAFVDAAISFYGAYAAWHWQWWQAALLSFPFAILGAVGVALGGLADLASKARFRRWPSR